MRVVALLATVVGLSIIAMLALVVMDVAVQAVDQFRQHFQARIASRATATSGSARRRRALATTASMTVKHGYIEIDCATIISLIIDIMDISRLHCACRLRRGSPSMAGNAFTRNAKWLALAY